MSGKRAALGGSGTYSRNHPPKEAKNARHTDKCEEEMKVWQMGGTGRCGNKV